MPYKNGRRVYNFGKDSRKTYKCLGCFSLFKSYFLNRKYCSVKCFQKSMKTNRLGKKNPMYGKHMSDKNKEKNSERLKGRIPKNFYEMRKLAWKNPRRGAKNNLWKGGITLKNHLLRQSPRYKKWRNKVYKRDFWTCRKCNKKCSSKEIVAHHLKSFSQYKKLRFVVSNGITLCRKCHMDVHRRLLNKMKK